MKMDHHLHIRVESLDVLASLPQRVFSAAQPVQCVLHFLDQWRDRQMHYSVTSSNPIYPKPLKSPQRQRIQNNKAIYEHTRMQKHTHTRTHARKQRLNRDPQIFSHLLTSSLIPLWVPEDFINGLLLPPPFICCCRICSCCFWRC